MTTATLIYLSLNTVVFVIWAFFMFRMLWRVTRVSLDRQAETGGGYFTWVGHSLNSFFAFFRDEAYKFERRRLILLSVLVMALTIAQPFLLPL
ncbi:hypothetical protein [Roseovarius sp. 2305UL8-3]|uniref:hypothetical protein n=1 Tax=Roseovarius conchicola TaxID=3121636 RepID=UPI003528DEE9